MLAAARSVALMTARTFLVTVSDSPARVVVEDVRNRRRAVAEDLAVVGRQIERLLARPQQPKASPSSTDKPRRRAGVSGV